MAAETGRFLKKLGHLEDVWEKFLSVPLVANGQLVQELRQRSRKIAACVRQEGNLNAGGKFEWVDSVLIKVSLMPSFLDCVSIVRPVHCFAVTED